MNDIHIREAVVEDAEDIRKLVSGLSHFYLTDKGAGLPEWFNHTLDINEFRRRIVSDEFNNYVALAGNRIIGYIALKGESHLYHLFVEQAYHGRGIATRLWQYVLKTSTADEFTLRSSLFAVPVYRQFGFIESSQPMEKDGIGFQSMRLTLR